MFHGLLVMVLMPMRRYVGTVATNIRIYPRYIFVYLYVCLIVEFSDYFIRSSWPHPFYEHAIEILHGMLIL